MPVAGRSRCSRSRTCRSPLQPALPPDAFDWDAAASLAEELAEAAPEPAPGIGRGRRPRRRLSRRASRRSPAPRSPSRRFDAEFDGEDVELRNLIAVVPGESERQIALIAQRDAAEEPARPPASPRRRRCSRSPPGSPAPLTRRRSSSSPPTAAASGRWARGASCATTPTPACSMPRSCSASRRPRIPRRRWSFPGQRARRAPASRCTRPPARSSPTRPTRRPATRRRWRTSSGLRSRLAIGEQGPLVDGGIDSVRLSSSGELPPEPGRRGHRHQHRDARPLRARGPVADAGRWTPARARSSTARAPTSASPGTCCPAGPWRCSRSRCCCRSRRSRSAGSPVAARSPCEAARGVRLGRLPRRTLLLRPAGRSARPRSSG